MDTSSTGSSSIGVAFSAASRKAARPAFWNAMSEESTECAFPSVEKGVRAQLDQGVLAGYPMTGIRVTRCDGTAHSVDSSDMAFQKAGRAALKDAAEKASPMLLEPVDEVSILVPDGYVGSVMSDLSGRRGRVLGTEPVGVGRTLIRAEVPELEITRYSIDLRSVSHGTGSFTRGYLRHEPLPAHLAAKVAADSRPE